MQEATNGSDASIRNMTRVKLAVQTAFWAILLFALIWFLATSPFSPLVFGRQQPAVKASPSAEAPSKKPLPTNAAEAEAWFKSLDMQTQACVVSAIGAERAQAAMKSGTFNPTNEEIARINVCLK